MYGLKFKLKRFIFKRKKASLKKHPLTTTEIYVYEICKSLMRNRESELFVSPLSGDRYIHNEEKAIIVYLKDEFVEITNHSYQYILSIRPIVLDDIKKYHDRVIESRKRNLEKTQGRNINVSLCKILNFVRQEGEVVDVG
jgi:hypothetical protein